MATLHTIKACLGFDSYLPSERQIHETALSIARKCRALEFSEFFFLEARDIRLLDC